MLISADVTLNEKEIYFLKEDHSFMENTHEKEITEIGSSIVDVQGSSRSQNTKSETVTKQPEQCKQLKL